LIFSGLNDSSATATVSVITRCHTFSPVAEGGVDIPGGLLLNGGQDVAVDVHGHGDLGVAEVSITTRGDTPRLSSRVAQACRRS
jgi:hypothetical protein